MPAVHQSGEDHGVTRAGREVICRDAEGWQFLTGYHLACDEVGAQPQGK